LRPAACNDWFLAEEGIFAMPKLTIVLAALFAGTLLLDPPGARAETASEPPFAKYPATTIHRGKPAAVDLSGRDARMFRTRLREAVAEAKGATFAGHMIVATWGCGTSCQSIALIDARNGKVTFASDTANLGVDFRVDSRLLVVNPPKSIRETYQNDPPPEWAKTWYYVWENGKLRKLP
jgi:hypothetical protein